MYRGDWWEELGGKRFSRALGSFQCYGKKPLTFNLEFSEYISISLAAKKWKTCLAWSLYTFTLSGFKGYSILKTIPFVVCVFLCHLEEVSVDADVELCK